MTKKSMCIMGSWSFGNGTSRKNKNFCVDNSSSSHADNRKNNFLELGEGLTIGNKQNILLEFALKY